MHADQCMWHRRRCTKIYSVPKFGGARVRNFYANENFCDYSIPFWSDLPPLFLPFSLLLMSLCSPLSYALISLLYALFLLCVLCFVMHNNNSNNNIFLILIIILIIVMIITMIIITIIVIKLKIKTEGSPEARHNKSCSGRKLKLLAKKSR